MLPHLSSAYNLARWLTRNEQDAEDLVQEAYLRAFRFFNGFKGSDGRAWLLAIVRNTFYSRLAHLKTQELTIPLDYDIESNAAEVVNPEVLVLQSLDTHLLRVAIEELPLEYREVIVLRELEELSYKEIADLLGIPIGTVMSRLARARKKLQLKLGSRLNGEANNVL
ncbi:MAG TPA: sigma-70 family RNA polymerase sigma factor [Chloroflexia bacterium]|nr:sigma-70 family RNA polymerase sigma factor [Chloroflexia bacterium]